MVVYQIERGNFIPRLYLLLVVIITPLDNYTETKKQVIACAEKEVRAITFHIKAYNPLPIAQQVLQPILSETEVLNSSSLHNDKQSHLGRKLCSAGVAVGDRHQ